MPTFLRKALNYLDEETKWLLAGKPIVSDQEKAFRRAQCNACDKRDPIKDVCTVCGCFLHKTGLGDALEMATKQCPLPEPKWLETVGKEKAPLVEEPIPTWRQVCIWIDNQGKPIYADALMLTM